LKRHRLVQEPRLLLEREPAQKEKTVTDRPENGNEVMEKKQETEESLNKPKERKSERPIESEEETERGTKKRGRKNMDESQSANFNLSRGDDAVVLSQLEIPRPESIRTDLTRSNPSSQNSTPKTLTPNVPDVFFKTRLCTNFSSKGFCGYRDGCTFAHGMEELQNSWEARNRVCKMYLKSGNCTYGANCSYMHVEKNVEVLSATANVADRKGPGSYKTNPCFSWRTTGRCSYGAYCRFIHADEGTYSRNC
jgi:Zinc finger C-x8-C-x5-C-x3-H type (and similar)